MTYLNYETLDVAAQHIAGNLESLPPLKLYGVPRGGIYAAMLLHAYLPGSSITEDEHTADVIVDDICDTGRTLSRYKNKILAALVIREQDEGIGDDVNYGIIAARGDWIEFPWERHQNGRGEGISSTVRNRLEYDMMPYGVDNKIGSYMSNEEIGMLREEIMTASRKFLDSLVVQHSDTSSIDEIMRNLAESYLDGRFQYRYLARG